MGSVNILILVLFIIGPALSEHPPTESSQTHPSAPSLGKRNREHQAEISYHPPTESNLTHPSAPSPGKRNKKEHQAEISYESVAKPQKRNWKRTQWTLMDCKINCFAVEGYIVGDHGRKIVWIAAGKLDAHKDCICKANDGLIGFLKERKLIISDFLDARKKSVTASSAWLINHNLTPRYLHEVSPDERRGEYDQTLKECETKCREDDGYLFGYSRIKRLWVSVASVDVQKNCHCKVNQKLLYLLTGMEHKFSDFLDARKESAETGKTWLKENGFIVLYP